MASRIIPGISLRAFWALGESGWKAGMDENIWRLSFLVQSRVLGVVETLPPGPEEGDRYILNNDASPYDQNIMVFDQDLWVPILPEDRFVVFNTENDSLMYFNQATNIWVSLISPEAIKEAYESNPNTNEFTDAEKDKLSDIENNATADMSAEEIKIAYESNPNSNAFTDAEKAKLSGLSSSRFLGVYPTLSNLQAAHPAPAVESFAYVDLGPSADIMSYIWDANSNKYVPQASGNTQETPETIKEKYEYNDDTNAFTDALKAKLDSLVLFSGSYNDLDDLPEILPDAASDGKIYARKNGNWVEVERFHNINLFIQGKPKEEEILCFYKTIIPFSLPASFTGSNSEALVASTGDVYFSVKKNGTEVATVRYNIASVGVFTAASAVTFNLGDTLTIVGSATVDDTLSDITINLKGSVV